MPRVCVTLGDPITIVFSIASSPVYFSQNFAATVFDWELNRLVYFYFAAMLAVDVNFIELQHVGNII